MNRKIIEVVNSYYYKVNGWAVEEYYNLYKRNGYYTIDEGNENICMYIIKENRHLYSTKISYINTVEQTILK